MAKSKIYPGQKFGRLTVSRLKRIDRTSSGRSKPIWECACECGNIIETSSANLLSGDTKSCGCWKKEVDKTKMLGNSYGAKHGESKDKLYLQFISLKYRCNKNSETGENSEICNLWLNKDNGYQLYKEWALQNGYNPETGYVNLLRYDKSKPYSPDNCYWGTRKDVSNNSSQNHNITHNGETKTVAQWAEDINMNKSTLRNRIWKGWNIEDALTKEIDEHRKIVNHNGSEFNLADWCYVTGLPQSTIYTRLMRHKPLDIVFFAPGDESQVNAIYFEDDNGRPISQDDYAKGIRVGKEKNW